MKNVIVAGLVVFSTSAIAQPATLNQCMACHAVDKKMVGPAFKDISTKYKSKADAVDYLSKSIKMGGAGKWGPIPMPAQKQLIDAQAKELAEWILTK